MGSLVDRVATVLLAVGALAGCDIYSGATEGENGALSFYEPNKYPGDRSSSAQGFELPIALGARADVWVLGPGIDSVQSAAIAAPEVLDLTFDFYPIVLRARSEGTTTLRVTTTKSSDTLPLTVVRPDGALLWTLETLAFTLKPDGYFGDGYALRPGASLRVAAQPTAGNQRLLGFDLFRWSIDPRLLSHRPDPEFVNTRVVEAMGVTGVTTISTQLGGAIELATLSEADPVTLTLYSIAGDSGTPAPVTSLTPEDVPLFLLAATDAEGRYVVPSAQDDRDFTAIVTDRTVVLLEAKRGGRFVELRACPGSGTITFSYMGAELSVPIEVTAEVADEECP